jgi:hypothetical protein
MRTVSYKNEVAGAMDIERHYFMTHLIALLVRFKPHDAFTVGYAIQYADETSAFL